MFTSKLRRRSIDWCIRSLKSSRGRRRPRLRFPLSVQPLEERRVLSLAPADADDPDDQISEAVPVNLGELVAGTIADGADVNMVSFAVPDSSALVFDLRVAAIGRDDPVVDAAIRLFDAAGNELAVSDSYNGGIEPYLEFSFTTGGTYYLGVSTSGNLLYDPISGEGDIAGLTRGAYELTILPLEAPDASGPEFRVNTSTAGGQGAPSVARDADGDFVVV
ncbi:MAG: PPC domain-containing protein, partial [Planctomycetes bacterium]|nr:PPC domain-containing protein [Planctomycetota bacterium]